jgi:hypothetical protein
MITPTRVAILLLLLLIVGLSVWSKIRFVDEHAQEPQRWRIEDLPRLRNDK